MKTLLVCVDFSDVTTKLLEQAQRMASAFCERIVLLHVSEPNPGFVSFDEAPELMRLEWADTFQVEHQQLEHLEKTLSQTGLEVKTILVRGIAADQILEYANSLHADMILMGSHGHGKLYHLLVGSATEEVLKKATVPVILVPKQQDANGD